MSKTAEEIIGKIERSRRVIRKHQIDIETNLQRIENYKHELRTKFGYEF